MADPSYPPPSAPLYQTQPGYQPQYQGPPPPGYYQGYQGGAPPDYHGYQGTSAPPNYQAVPTTTTVIVRGGDCPACNVGHMNTEFTILGICLAVLFFPIGVLCCLLLTEKRCNHCGMTFN